MRAGVHRRRCALLACVLRLATLIAHKICLAALAPPPEALLARLQAGRILAARAAAAGQAAMEAEGAVGDAAVDASADAAAPPPLSAAQARRVCAALREASAALLPSGDAGALAVRDGTAAAAALAAAAAALAASLPPGFFEPLLSRDALAPADLAALQELNGLFCTEYRMRREMLIHRVDCTLDALLTSPRTAAPARRAEAMRAVAPERAAMSAEPGVRCAAMRADHAAWARFCVRCACADAYRAAAPQRGGRVRGVPRSPGQRGAQDELPAGAPRSGIRQAGRHGRCAGPRRPHGRGPHRHGHA